MLYNIYFSLQLIFLIIVILGARGRPRFMWTGYADINKYNK